MEKYFLAIDIGASSGRHILGCLKDGRIELEEVYRFENGMDKVEETGKDGQKKTVLVWNLDRLFNEIITGMKKCKFHLDISDNSDNDEHSEKIQPIFVTFVVFHVDISGNDIKLEHL